MMNMLKSRRFVVPSIIILLSFLVLCLAGQQIYNLYTNDPFKGVAPFHLEEAGLNTYWTPCDGATMCVKFERKITNREILGGRLLSYMGDGFVGARMSEDNQVLRVLFRSQDLRDGNTLMMRTHLYQAIDDPKIFAGQ